jgi:hypothetical protein
MSVFLFFCLFSCFSVCFPGCLALWLALSLSLVTTIRCIITLNNSLLLLLLLLLLCRVKAKHLSEQLKESVMLVADLKVAIEAKHHAFDTECGKIEAVCNPKQTVLFLMWVTKNAEALSKVCIIMI